MGALIIFMVATVILCFVFFMFLKLDCEIWKLEKQIKKEGKGYTDSGSLKIRILNIFPILIWTVIGLFVFFSISIVIHIYMIERISSMTVQIVEEHEKNQELQRKEEYYKGYIRYLEKQLDTSTINHQ